MALLKSKLASSSKLKKSEDPSLKETKITSSTPDDPVLSLIHYHDVIIIGGGLTGLRAALQVSNAGLNGAVVTKVHPLRSHSVAAQGGMNASLGNVPVKKALVIVGKRMHMIR